MGKKPHQKRQRLSPVGAGRRGEGSIERTAFRRASQKFGGCPSVRLRVRDTAGKYAGNCKTETL